MKNQTPILFSHANGFGLKTYNYFLEQLNTYNIIGVDKLGHNPQYPLNKNWHNLRKELLNEIRNNRHSKVIGIGHSLGGILTFMAALENPHLFERVILLDPPMVSYSKRKMIAFISFLGLVDYFAPSKKSKKRKTHFESIEEAYKYFEKKYLFKYFDKNCFNDYVYNGLKKSKNGVELDFSSEIETEIFRSLPTNYPFKSLEIPSHFIYSSKHEVLQEKDIKWLKRNLKTTRFLPFNAGHLFPLEKPIETAQLIKSIIEA